MTLDGLLVRDDGQEDLTFALWYPSEGTDSHHRPSHVVTSSAEPGDREIHGNVSFNASYLQRALEEALRNRAGLAFLHSHPFPGWQYMSEDDVAAENRIARAACALTGMPLIGMTTGNDGTWSARTWVAVTGQSEPRMSWLPEVRVVGEALHVSRTPHSPRPERKHETLIRTVAAWGDDAQIELERTRVGIVGLGSVGSMVGESMARIGAQKITLIDFDLVEPKNLDRLVAATEADVGRLKVEVAAERIRSVATAATVDLCVVPEKISPPRSLWSCA